MHPEFDYNFEIMRLNKLLEQLHPNDNVVGQVVFGCTEIEDAQTFSNWFFDHELYKQLKESGFTHMLLHLIDILIAHRRSFFESGYREGVITFHKSNADIEWLSDGKAEILIKKLNERENTIN
jgi:hypothetical protein